METMNKKKKKKYDFFGEIFSNWSNELFETKI